MRLIALTVPTSPGSGLCTQHFHRQRTRCIIGGGKGMRCRQASFDNGQGAVADNALQALDGIGALAEIDPSESQMTSTLGAVARKRSIAGSASVRSTP